MKVEVVTGALPCVLGEGPHWDATEGVLYYVDIPQGRVLRYDPQNNNTSYVNVSVIFRLNPFIVFENTTLKGFWRETSNI